MTHWRHFNNQTKAAKAKRKRSWPNLYTRVHGSGQASYVVDIGLINGKRERHSFRTKAEAGTFAELKRGSTKTRITPFGVVEKLPLILNGAREAIAQLRPDYSGTFLISLVAPKIEPTPAQQELEAKFRKQCDEWESENHQREWRERLDRIYRHDLKQQAGEKVNPQEFAAPPPGEYPPASWDQEEEAEDDDASEFGDVAVKKNLDPPPSWLDDEHPLADQYRLMGTVELDEIRAVNYAEQLFTYLMGRQPDLVIPQEECPSN